MSKPQEMYRKIFLSEDIEISTVKPIIEKIMEINNSDDLYEADYKDWERKPIYLFINSYGGDVYGGLALFDVIKQSKTPVYTVSIGSSMSMGLWIYLAGHKRYVGEHATLMFHDITSGVFDKVEGIRQELEECSRLQKMICATVTEASLVKQETLDDYINRKAEWYIPAEDAIRLKLADGYYKYE